MSKLGQWLQGIATWSLAVLGVLGFVKEKESWYPYVFIAAFLLGSQSHLVKLWKSVTTRWKQRRALKQFSGEYIHLIDRARNFVENKNSQLSITQFFEMRLSNEKLTIKRYNSHTNYLFHSVLLHLHAKATKGFRRYAEFEESNDEFTSVMDTFVTIYADDMIQELKRDDNFSLLDRQNVNDLKQMYANLNLFVNDYNSFRGRLAAHWSTEARPMYVRIPRETF